MSSHCKKMTTNGSLLNHKENLYWPLELFEWNGLKLFIHPYIHIYIKIEGKVILSWYFFCTHEASIEFSRSFRWCLKSQEPGTSHIFRAALVTAPWESNTYLNSLDPSQRCSSALMHHTLEIYQSLHSVAEHFGIVAAERPPF